MTLRRMVPRPRPARAQEPRVLGLWEKSQIVANALTPIMIAVGTVYINWQINDRSLQQAQQQERVSRLSLVPNLIAPLTSTDSRQQVIAVYAINSLLPDEADSLLKQIAIAPGILGGPASEAAQQVLDELPTVLTRQLFSPSEKERISALNRLLGENGPDPMIVVPFLLRFATEHINEFDGVANSLRYLRGTSLASIKKNETEVIAFARLASGNGDNTSRLASNVLDRIPGASL